MNVNQVREQINELDNCVKQIDNALSSISFFTSIPQMAAAFNNPGKGKTPEDCKYAIDVLEAKKKELQSKVEMLLDLKIEEKINCG